MGEPADTFTAITAIQATLDTLVTSLASLQTSVEANAQAIQCLDAVRAPPGGSGAAGCTGFGEHHQDCPSWFQKMDFSRYDGKTDPLIFINRCESYFHQQRIMEEEKVWMASYNLEDGAQMWYIQVQTDEGTPSWRWFKELLNLRYAPLSALLPSSNWRIAAARAPSRSIRIASRHFFPAPVPCKRRKGCSCSRAGSFHRSASTFRFTIHNPFAAAMSLALQLELREQYALAPAKGVPRGLLPAPAPRLALPAPPIAKADAPVAAVDGWLPVKRLSLPEQEERRRQGLCFNCNECYTRGHNRVCKRIFFINGVDIATAEDATDEDAPDVEAPVFSLHAVAHLQHHPALGAPGCRLFRRAYRHWLHP
jgi:hypothetical protein